MTSFEIEYITTGNHRKDKITLTLGETIEFETGTEKITNITDAIEVFEMIAAKWWGTYETKNSITNIKVKEIK